MPYIRDKPGTGKSCWVDTRKHECKLQAHSQSQNCRSFQAALLRQQGAQKGLCRISGTSLAHKPCNELAQKARLQASRHRTEQQASSCLQQPYLGSSSGTDKAVPYIRDASCARLDSQEGTALLP